jgi:hypothetical protein
MSKGSALDQIDQGGKINDTPDSNAPLRTAAALTGCLRNTRPIACGSAVQDRWMDGLCGYKTRLSIGECHSDRRNGQSNATGDLAGHALPARTHKTVRLVLLALALTSKLSPVAKDD